MGIKENNHYNKDFVYSFVMKDYDEHCLELKEEFGVEAMKEFMRVTQEDADYEYIEVYYNIVDEWRHTKNN